MVRLLVSLAIALGAVWLIFIVALAALHPKNVNLGDAVRILPDTIRLLRRIASDPSVPRRARVALWCLFGYLAMPIDLVPDFIPVLGYADDAIAVAIVLRYVVNRAGLGVVQSHWPGTEAGLSALCRLAGLRDER